MNTPKRWVRTTVRSAHRPDGPHPLDGWMLDISVTIAPTADIEEMLSLLQTAYVNSDARLIGGWADRYRALLEKREGETACCICHRNGNHPHPDCAACNGACCAGRTLSEGETE